MSDERPPYRPYRVSVQALRALNPRFTRVTFAGPELDRFGTGGRDQRIKLLLPLEHGITDIGTDGDWYARWRALPAARRNPLRTYTVRAVRPTERELDVDFAVHAHGGPAAAWLASATLGAELVLVGPDARTPHTSAGIDWQPGRASDVLLAGDETAVPAISSILESLSSGVRATAFVQVPVPSDALPIATSADVHWLAPGGLLPAVRAWLAEHPQPRTADRQPLEDVDIDTGLLWEAPVAADGAFYAWLAGEAGLIKQLRRLLVVEAGVDRRQVACMGYWRRGRAELQ